MEPISEDKRDQFLTTFQREAVHLEMRDVYATNIEKDRFHAWLHGEPLGPETEAQWWQPWFELMKRTTEGGKTLRRLRIVSEPVTDYIRFEWLDAAQLVRAGEDVRWLPGAMCQSSCCRVMTFGCSTARQSLLPTSPGTGMSLTTK